MKLWILGKKGLLGSTLHALCQTKKISSIATSREEADISHLEHLKRFLDHSEAKEITHIINCAAYTDVDRAEKEKEIAYQVNALGPENIGLVAQKIGAKVVHISTDYVFDGSLGRPYTETDQCFPLSVYGKTKWEGENNLLAISPSACIIRVSWLFGNGGKNFISSVLQKLKTESSLSVVSDQRGRATFTPDLAEVILELLCHSGIYHFANQGEVSRFDIAKNIYEKAKALAIPMACQNLSPTPSHTFPTPAKRPSYSVLNTKKIETLLGESPRSWETALQDYLCAIKNS